MPVPTTVASEVPVAARLTSKLTAPSIPLPTTTPGIIDAVTEIISSYILTNGANDQFLVSGRKGLRSRVARFIQKNERIDIALPAFPFKSPSRAKVLGPLPDMAEEVVLRRLEGLCRSIEDVYEKGAVIHIVSDGVVYAELLGVSDRTVYQYNAALRCLVQQLGLNHISFVRVSDLHRAASPDKNYVLPVFSADLSEEEYVASAPIDRSKFLARDIGPYNLEESLANDIGVLRTYRGYLKFLKQDLADSHLLKDDNGKLLSRNQRDKVIGGIAKEMIKNGARFSHLVESAFPHSVRLSIHPHNNAGPKLALQVFPYHDTICTPWHNALCEKADGTTVVAQVSLFDDERHELVYRYGRPYLIREKDEDMKWGDYFDGVNFERLYPFGLKIIAPASEEKLEFAKVPMDKVRRLCIKHSLVLFSGFKSVDKPGFIQKSKEMGTIMPWTFGELLEIKDTPTVNMNSSLTREAMPMHYDGVFKVKVGEDGSTQSDPPLFQSFQCLDAPSGDEGGLTLFTHTSQILQSLSQQERDSLKNKRWHVFTPSNDFFGGVPFDLPLITQHHETKHDVLRWHEEWSQELTNFKFTNVHFNDMAEEESRKLSQTGLWKVLLEDFVLLLNHRRHL
ncbi:hypothetical protein FRC02_008475 [Tulasnella sp. 418]|nr:hypothetical protein FRC02_008475 [Tulasnella sp. 418]